MQGANSPTKLSNSNWVIFNQFSMLAGLARTSNKENRYSSCTMWHEQYEYFVRPFLWVLANGFLSLVGASPPRIENWLKITKLEFNNLVFEFAPSEAFDTIICFQEETTSPLIFFLKSL